MSDFRSLEDRMQENVFAKITNSKLREQLQNTFRAGYGVFADALPFCAEIALKNNDLRSAQATLDVYFSSDPAKNQCLARAYFCQARLLEPKNCDDQINLKKCAEWIRKAIDFGKNAERHYFLVYNASVLSWQLCRAFLRKGYRRHLCSHLAVVVGALDDIDDNDYAWRAELMIELVKCYVDDGEMKDAAVKCAALCFKFCEKCVPEKLEDIIAIQVQEGLVELKALLRDLKSLYLYCFAKFVNLQGQRDEDFATEMEKLFNLIWGQKKPSKKSTIQRTPMTEEQMASILVKLAHLCLERGLVERADEILRRMPPGFKNPMTVLSNEHLQCVMMVKKMGVGPEEQTSAVVKKRRAALGRSCEALRSAIRMESPAMIQAGCGLVWNMSLPLLQPNLRHFVTKPLQLVAEALEKINSMLYDLRCKVHIELAKCKEDEDKIDEALASAYAAKKFDSSRTFSQELSLAIDRLHLRSATTTTTTTTTDQSSESLAHPRRIVEQISAVPGICRDDTYDEVHDILVVAGKAIAPREFTWTLDDDLDERRSAGGGKGNAKSKKNEPLIPLAQKLQEDVKRYELATRKTREHVQSVSTEEDVKRVLLWADLAKLARRQKIWDVARSAARFCVSYDDNRWQLSSAGDAKADGSKTSLKGSSSSIGLQSSTRSLGGSRSRLQMTGSSSSSMAKKRRGHTRSVNRVEKVVATLAKATSSAQEGGLGRNVVQTIVRSLAEAHLLYAENLVVLLNSKGLKFLSEPRLDSTQQDVDAVKDVDQVWLDYCKWIGELCKEVIENCHRAAKLGSDLQEPWLIYRTMVFLFNATSHMAKTRQADLAPLFAPLIMAYKSAGGFKENKDYSLLCEMTTTFAEGVSATKQQQQQQATSGTIKKWSDKTSKKQESRESSTERADETTTDSKERGNDKKTAYEIVEYVQGVCAGKGVPLRVRSTLAAAWVQLKVSMQQIVSQSTSNFGLQETDPQFHQLCAAIAVERIACKTNDSNETMTIPDAFGAIEACDWEDPLVALQLYTRLAGYCLRDENYAVGDECCTKALLFSAAKIKLQTDDQQLKQNQLLIKHELLCQAAQIQGQLAVHLESDGVKQRRMALDSFLVSARHAREARSYDLLMTTARHVWNTCQPVVGEPLERELMRKQVSELLRMIADVTGRKKEDFGTHEDMEIRIWLYSIVFMSYADKSEWAEGLKAVDDAIWIMPKSSFWILAKYRLLFKNKLGKSVIGDLQRFLDEDEEDQATLWHDVAVNNVSLAEQFNAHRNAIGLTKNKWLKVDWLIDFGCWLYNNGLSRRDASAQLEKAAMILSEESAVEPSDKRCECKRLLLLAKVDVMLARMTESRTGQYLGYLVEATKCYRQIWKLQEEVLSSAGIAENGSREEAEDKKGRKSKAVKRKSTVAAGDISKSSFHLPSTVTQWASFQVPSEVRERLRKELRPAAFNKNSVTQAVLEAFYMTTLVSELMDQSLHFLALPVLCLYRLLAQDILESPAVVDLAELRLIECCRCLGLTDAMRQHEQAFRGAVSLEERLDALGSVEIMHDKKRLAAIEERRRRGDEQEKEEENLSKRSEEDGDELLVVPVLGQLELRMIWADQADILLQQGRYQLARGRYVLCEKLARAYKDSPTLTQCLCGLSRLALLEGQTTVAVALATEAQKCRADPYVHVKVLLTFVDVMQADPTRRGQARLVLIDAIKVFRELARDKPAMGAECSFVWATLQARLAEIQFQSLLADLGQLRRRPRKKRDLEVALMYYKESWEELLKLERTIDAVKVMKKHCLALRVVAEETSDVNQRRQRLAEAHSVMEEARRSAEEWAQTVGSMVDRTELKGITLPADLTLVETIIDVGDGLWLIMDEDGRRRREKWLIDKQTSSMQKLVDEYTVATPQLTESEETWERLAQFSGSHAVALLSAALSGCGRWPRLQAKIGIRLGQCLCLMGDLSNITSSSPWTIVEEREEEIEEVETEANKTSDENETVGDSEEEDDEGTGCSNEGEKTETIDAESSALRYLSQGIEILTQSIYQAIQTGDLETAGDGSLYLVQCYGRRDPLQTALFLSLFQSCRASLWMKSLLMTALSNPLYSQLAGLMHQRRYIATDNPSSLFEANTHALEPKEAYRRLQLQRNYHQLMAGLSTGICFVTLQHSPDRKYIYGSITRPSDSKPSVACVETDSSLLMGLVDDIAENRDDWAQYLLRLNFLYRQARLQHQTESDFRASPSLGDQGQSAVTSRIELVEEEEERIEERFGACIKAMNDYLGPLTSQLPIQDCLEEATAVVLLVDEWLLKLPLESLDWLKCCREKGLARDVSLQMFHHRFCAATDGDSSGTSPGKKAGKKVAATPKTPANIGKDKGKEQKGNVKPDVPDTVPVDLARVKYVLDPCSAFNEKAKEDEDWAGLIQSAVKNSGSLTSKWSGWTGQDGVLSDGQWTDMLKASSSFFFFGSERFLAHLLPCNVPSLDLTACRAIVLADRAQTNQTYLKQSKLDANKSPMFRALENSTETALLLSLAGVKSVVVNQWATTAETNSKLIRELLKALVSENDTIGQAIQHFKYGKPEPKPNSTEEEPNQNPPEETTQITSKTMNPIIYGLPNVIFNPPK
ncbi:cilia- and flagella-associated protein 46-like isoform X2 [Oscarella lobularis]|uniref:cilia- and flagella-associated protein 46-like isoform X2 n=1 Tax=Oscarella lobularis TaxID=121494 RepID=UPI0033138460